MFADECLKYIKKQSNETIGLNSQEHFGTQRVETSRSGAELNGTQIREHRVRDGKKPFGKKS